MSTPPMMPMMTEFLPEFLPMDMLFPPEEEEMEAPVSPETDVIHLTTEQAMRLSQQLRAHYDEAIQARDELTTRREERYRRYLADTALRAGKQAWEEAPRLFLPLTRTSIEKLKDEFVEAIGSVESITARGVGEEDTQQATRQTQFLRHVLSEVNPMPWEDLVDFGIHDALQDSLALYKIYPYQSPFALPTATGDLLKTIIRWDRVDEGTMLLPPNHTGFQWPECAYIGQQLWVSLDEFPAMTERGFTLPDPASIGKGEGRQYTDDERALLEFTRQGMEPDQAANTYDPRVEMVESYELFAVDPTGAREFVVVHWFPHLSSMAYGRGQIARVMLLENAMRQEVFPRPMWPFMPLTIWQQPGQARGMNVPERLETSQDILNRLAEQMIEQGEIDILPFIFANIALSGDLPNLRRIKPGEVVPLDAMGSVQFSPRQSNNRHYIEQMSVARSWAEEDVGVTAYVQGRNQEQPNAPRTLGGMAMMLQQSQKGFKKQVHHIARQLRQAIKLYLGLWQAHVRPTLSFPVQDTETLAQRLFEGRGAQQTMVRMDDAAWSVAFDVTLKVNPEAHLEQQKRLMMAEKLDEILAPVYPLGRRELWRDVWETLGLQEFERFYPEAVAVVQTQLLMLKAQLEMAAMEMQIQQASAPPAPPGMPGGSPPMPGGQGMQGIDMPALVQSITAMLQGGGAAEQPTGETAGGMPPMPAIQPNPLAVGA